MGIFEDINNKQMNLPSESPKISVIVPVKNASETIDECLDAIYANNNADFEVVVVDDGCTDNTMDIVSRYKCKALKNNVHSGVSGARNTGAFAAGGDVVVFIDSDIVVPENALAKISARMQDADIAAVVGMLSENIRFDNFASQYKNLWMCYTFDNLPGEISLIFSSIAAIRKDIFLESGGFDVNYAVPNVEDNELGIRLREAGYNIFLDKTLKVEHLKKYSFYSLLATHYFRTKGLIKLYNRRSLIGLSRGNPSNVPNLFLFNVPLTIVLIFSLSSLFLKNNVFPKITIIFFLILAFVFINYKWLSLLNRKRGLSLALKGLFYLPVEFLAILSGLAVGQLGYFMGKRY